MPCDITVTASQRVWAWVPRQQSRGAGRQCRVTSGIMASLNLLAPLGLQWPPPLHHLQPCPSASTAGTEQDPGDSPQGHRGCSLMLTFALSSPACVLCGRADVDPDICGRTFAKSGIRVHEFCLVSSPPKAPYSCLPGMLLSFLA